MGAKTWMLVYADGDARAALKAAAAPDVAATESLAARLFPGESLHRLEDASLGWTNPPGSELVIGCFPGIRIVAAREFALDRPSKLPQRFIAAGGAGTVQVFGMHSGVDWFAYAAWSEGRLVRAISVSPDSGILEDVGDRLAVERPYWAGQYPVGGDTEAPGDRYPLPFHPLEFGEAVLDATLGFQYEGCVQSESLEPEQVPLLRYKRTRTGWLRRLVSGFARSASSA